MFKTSICAAAALFSLVAATAAQADQYAGPGFAGTAFTNTGGGGVTRLGPVYVDRDGFRMNIANSGQSIASLIRWDEPFAYSLVIDQQVYVKVAVAEIGMDGYEARPCLSYESSRKLGSERVNGRLTEKWRCSGELNPKNGAAPVDSTTWYDPELAFEIKAVTDDGNAFEIRDIAVGRQDSKLFEIPPGFQELDMNAMMQGRQ